jgi:hypothetical protein
MRRLAVWSLAPMVLAAVLVGGCGAKGGGTPSAAGTDTATAGAPGASATPSAGRSDPALANTRQVCDAINRALADGSAAFGNDLGTIAGHVAGGNTSQADRARADAVAQLKSMVTKIRSAAGTATDPKVRAAAGLTADEISALAADPALLKVKSAADLAPVIEKLTRASDAMNSVCV